MEQSPNERRRFSRIHFAVPAQLQQGSIQQSVAIIDIALKGVLIESTNCANFDFARPLRLTITLAENAVIDMEVKHIHQSNDHLGFQCIGIDTDSIGHLRRIIEFNLGDSAAAERELAELFS